MSVTLLVILEGVHGSFVATLLMPLSFIIFNARLVGVPADSSI